MRRESRYISNASVTVTGGNGGETGAALGDISQHGLSIKSGNYIDIVPDSPYVIAIVPEKETNIEQFQLEIKSRWVKLNKSQMESGFTILVPFDTKGFKDYLEYLAREGKETASGEPADGNGADPEA